MPPFNRYFILAAFFVGISATVFMEHEKVPTLPATTTPPVEVHDALEDTPRSGSALFVGDVMLARYVERFAREQGTTALFHHVADYLHMHDAVVANFEAAVPAQHVPTPAMAFAFSVDRNLLSGLQGSGITHFGLANNHSYDFGAKGYRATKAALREEGFTVGGDQEGIADEDVMYLAIGDLTVAVVPVYAVVNAPQEELDAAFMGAQLRSDIQIAYVHWGEEYDTKHSSFQERLAHRMIERGADAVIGHHPHVIQDIARYRGAPIFYSLGNFIFDQYWNEEVQTGLGVALKVDGRDISFVLLPHTSVQSVPTFAEGEERSTILRAIAERSASELRQEIILGTVEAYIPLLASIRK